MKKTIIDKKFGTKKNTTIIIGPNITGLGGDSKIWACDSEYIYELNPSDFSVKRAVPTPVEPNALGGDDTNIYLTNGNRIYKLNPSDFSIEKTLGLSIKPKCLTSGILISEKKQIQELVG